MNVWNGHKAALSLTFDDGLQCQLDHAVPAMDSLGIRGTFFLPTDCPQYPLDIPRWMAAAHTGHEIGSHSQTHRKAASMEVQEMKIEARGSKRYLEQVFERKITSFCYPYTDAPRDYQDQVRAFYQQARGGRVARADKIITPGDNVNIFNVPCLHVSGAAFERSEIFPVIHEAVDRGGWVVLMLHGVGPDESQWDNVPSAWFTTLLGELAYLRIHKQLWTAPFGEVAAYYRGMR